MKNMKSKLMILSIICSLLFISKTTAQQLRPPAYPLITTDPYFSIWSFNDSLSAASTVHWTGKDNSLQGIIRVDGKSYYFLGEPLPQVETVLPLVLQDGKWKFIEREPGSGWNNKDFDDSLWEDAIGAFDDKGKTPNNWATEDLWVRRNFELKDLNFNNLMLNLHQDDNIQVFLNGVLAFEKEGWNHAPEHFPINEAAKKTLRKGNNVLAIHIRNTKGGGYLDAGLVDVKANKSSLLKATQKGYKISATQTIYNFEAAGVALDLRFSAPFLLDDLDLLSRPTNYVTFSTRSVDGNSHDVQLYFSAAGNIAVNTVDQEISWKRESSNELDLLRLGTTSQNILGRKGDDVRIDWGYLYLGVPRNKGAMTSIGSSFYSVDEFLQTGTLKDKDDSLKPRPAGEDPISLASAFDMGKVSSSSVDRHILLAYNQLFPIEYFQRKLEPWWRRDGMTFKEMLDRSEAEYYEVLERCDRFDTQLRSELLAAGGEKYAQMGELAYRQSIAAHKLVEGPEGKPLFFSKENFSNGSIATVDITYPSSPLYLMYNPDLLKGMMIPILYYSESGKYDYPFAAHDVGTYPIANGMTYGEPMPIEETGNMLILAAAIAKAEGNASFAKEHWRILSIWAEYLKEKGLDPDNQLSTDDFSGHLAHNANLSIKAILGLASYGYLANQIDKKKTGKDYMKLAKDYAREWMKRAEDGDHYSLTFDKKGTWSQKYNLIWDKVLQFNIFPDEVAEKELRYYLTKQNKYGLPLDSRETYTKADWILWTATLAEDTDTFNTLVAPLFKYFSETPSRVPMSDWYQTTDAKQMNFQARSVIGGLFMKALDFKWNE